MASAFDPEGVGVRKESRPCRSLITIQANGGDWKPDVVLCNPLSNPRLEERLVELAPVVFFAHTFFGTCVSGTKMHAFPSRRPCTRRFGLPCLALYWPRRCGGWNPITALSLFQKERRRRRVLGRVQRIVVASHFMETELTRNGVDPSSIEVVGFPSTEIVAPPNSTLPAAECLVRRSPHQGQRCRLALGGCGAARERGDAAPSRHRRRWG